LEKQDAIHEKVKALRQHSHGYDHSQRWQPVLFGSDKFEGLSYLLHNIKTNKCPLYEVNRFKGRV